MKHRLYFYAMAALSLGLTACSEQNDIVEGPPTKNVTVPIQFSSARSTVTRAGSDVTGAEAANLLGGKFVVTGYKGSTSATPGTIVFDNYLVEYAENTANTTESNTSNWEYVGKAPIKHATDNGIVAQTIKYWDYSTAQYDFIAWSTGTKTAIYTGSPAAGEVLVSAITPATATGTTADPARVAYTFKGKAADLSQCYVADLVTVKKANYGDGVGDDLPVTIRFRSLGTKVRIALYETVPGYSVKNVRFYQKAGVLTDPSTEIVSNATIFTVTANDIKTEGTYTVYFPTVDTPASADNNQAHIKFDGGTADQRTTVEMGALNYTIAELGEKTAGKVFLGRSSNTATYAGDAATNYYTTYLPNENGTNLNLRVDFDLEATDGSGEVINVKNASAQVPLIYATWKPGYAYTYIFKISDKTNGRTGNYDPTLPDNDPYNADPAGLYPITFDAVVVNDEAADVMQETITTISTPSITSYQKGSQVQTNDEYTANGNDIFVTVNEDGALVTLTGKAALYTIPAGKTEAEVVDALSYQDDDAATGTIKGRSDLVLTNATSTLDNKIQYGVDGNEIALTTDQALRFTPTAATTYAFVYTKTAPTTTTDYYQALDFASFATGATKYRYAYKAATHSYYSDNGTPGDDTDDVEYFDAQKGVKYFKLDGGVYTMQSPFLGQVVSNLYLDAAGNTIATGNAVTGTTYYYTTNGGASYTAATNVTYANYLATYATFYKDAACTVVNDDATPVNGTAYYDSTGKFIVIQPEQTNTWYELNTASYVVADEAAAVAGQTYFDKYSKNNGVYYTKVIKVQ